MDAEKLVKTLSIDEIQELVVALPSEVIRNEAIRRRIEIPATVGATAVKGEVAAAKVDVKETIMGQLYFAGIGYQTIAEQINSSLSKKNRFEIAFQETIAAGLDVWLTQDKLDYVKEAIEVDPELQFTLVTTPNVLVNQGQLISLARNLGKKTYVRDTLYAKYTPEQLSGIDHTRDNSIAFSLIPSKPDENLYGTAASQRVKLAELQKSHQFIKVPSVLEAITYWYALRAGGSTLSGSTAFDATYIRHFDLPEKNLVGWARVPDSYVRKRCRPELGDSYASLDGRARVAVG
jgi:hypothetical protein